jgi:hypothetical protein
MSHHKVDDKKIKNAILSQLKKRELEYNQMAHISSTELNKLYHENSVVYIHMDGKTTLGDKKKAMEMEKKIYTNHDKNKNIKISQPTFYQLDNLLAITYQINYHDCINNELQQMIQKLTIKDVDMNALMKDLNDSGINVNNLLQEFNKHGKNLDSLLEYLNKQNIGLTNIMNILYRNNVTINGLIQNEFIHDLIKQSPTYAWFLNGKELPKATKEVKIEHKATNKINVYAIYKDDLVVNINWIDL